MKLNESKFVFLSLYDPQPLSDYQGHKTIEGNVHNLYDNRVKYVCLKGERLRTDP